LSIAVTTPARLVATTLGISQRVISIVVASSSPWKPRATIGTYAGARNHPTTASKLSTASKTLNTVLPRRHADSSSPRATYSENTGTSALTSAPLNTPKRIVGIVAAARNASISICVPNDLALTTSRPNPRMLDASVATITTTVDRARETWVGAGAGAGTARSCGFTAQRAREWSPD
jgi:hypothetical protein